MEARTMGLVIEGLTDLPDTGLVEVLDFVRFQISIEANEFRRKVRPRLDHCTSHCR
jgi:hypothetical protein